MSGKIRHIKRKYPEWIPVLMGSPMELVNHRELIKKYEVNRDIKYWATWYLLKSLSVPSQLQHWTKQKKYLLTFLQMNEGTFRSHLRWLKENKLLTIEKVTWTIKLVSYEDAAQIQGISYEGTYKINYHYEKRHTRPGAGAIVPKQSFQYLLRAEEIERRKEISLAGLIRKLDKNQQFRNDIFFILNKYGCDMARIHTDPEYLQQRLLQVQLECFREGSEILDFVFTHRADINRGVKKIKEHHGYKSAQSVTYMKRKLFFLGFIDVTKICITSKVRSRLYIPDDEKGGMREGYKWLLKDKATALFLTDQITARYSTDLETSISQNIKMTA
jgi:hypothetical protein